MGLFHIMIRPKKKVVFPLYLPYFAPKNIIDIFKEALFKSENSLLAKKYYKIKNKSLRRRKWKHSICLGLRYILMISR